MTTDEFVLKAKQVHGDKYDYSNVVYTGNRQYVVILCPTHGEFRMRAGNHINHQCGCKKCGRVSSRHTCLDRYGVDNPSKSVELHNKKKQTMVERFGVEYPYQSKELWEKRTNSCFEHLGVEHSMQSVEVREKAKRRMVELYGVEHYQQSPILRAKFEQTCLRKYGVTRPAKSPFIQNRTKHTCLERYGVEYVFKSEQVKEKIRQVVLSRYGVESILQSPDIRKKYKNTLYHRYGVKNPSSFRLFQEKKKITCLKKYGVEFSLQSTQSLEKTKKTTLERYGVEKYNQFHIKEVLPFLNDFDWLYDQYVTQNKTSVQIAKELNVGSSTTVCDYLRKHEIGITQSYTQSFKALTWLLMLSNTNSVNIKHACNGGEYLIVGTKFKADGFCEATNTIYEFYGDYWHGNPNKYSADVINSSTNTTMGELYEKTIKRENKIKELGYNLVVIWEEEWDNLQIILDTGDN